LFTHSWMGAKNVSCMGLEEHGAVHWVKKVGVLICGFCFQNLKVALQRLPQGKKKWTMSTLVKSLHITCLQVGKSWTKEGVATCNAVVWKNNWFTYLSVFLPLTLKPEIGLESCLRTILNNSLKPTPPWTCNRQVPWNIKPLTEEIENLKTWTQLQIEQFLAFANISFTWNRWVSIWNKPLGHDIQNVKERLQKNLGHGDPWFSQVGWDIYNV
jgi:hypothetical protein